MYTNYDLNKIENSYIVYNKTDRNHYEIGYVDYKILQYIQEGKTDEYICGQLSIDKNELNRNKLQLFEIGLLSEVKLKKKARANWNKIYIFRVDTSRLKSGVVTVLLERLLISLCMLSAAVVLFFILGNKINWERVVAFNNASLLEITSSLIFVQMLTVMAHEFFHLIFAINRGACVPEIGVMIYYLSPSGFSDLTQINFFKEKSSKIICLLAGLLFNFTLLVFSLLIFLIFDLQIFQYIFLTNLVAIVINLGFYIKLDGYYILQILLEENYLREKSLSIMKKTLIGQLKVNEVIYYIVGLCSIIYIPILLINILTSLWGHFV